jgi:hypothetical protein
MLARYQRIPCLPILPTCHCERLYRACRDADVAHTWQPTNRWVQVRQLLSCGAAKTSQAVVAFREISRLAAVVSAVFNASGTSAQRLSDAILAVASSRSGMNRQLSKAVFVRDCNVLVDAVRAVIFDPGEVLERLDERAFWWEEFESELQNNMAAEALKLPEASQAAVDAFFACAPLPALGPSSCCLLPNSPTGTPGLCKDGEAFRHDSLQLSARRIHQAPPQGRVNPLHQGSIALC